MAHVVEKSVQISDGSITFSAFLLPKLTKREITEVGSSWTELAEIITSRLHPSTLFCISKLLQASIPSGVDFNKRCNTSKYLCIVKW